MHNHGHNAQTQPSNVNIMPNSIQPNPHGINSMSIPIMHDINRHGINQNTNMNMNNHNTPIMNNMQPININGINGINNINGMNNMSGSNPNINHNYIPNNMNINNMNINNMNINNMNMPHHNIPPMMMNGLNNNMN